MSELSDRLRGISSVCHDWSTELRQAADEIDRLQAIVDLLPKTADGVSIYPGMILWTTYDTAMVTVEWFCRAHASNMWIIVTDRGSRTEEECYSTREAVEKARTT